MVVRALALIFLLSFAGEETMANPWPGFDSPSTGRAAAIGGTSNGCLAGAVALPPAGRGFISIRRERNRFYGHPVLIELIEALGAKLAREAHRPMMVGDLAQPRGGRMASMHVSHQNGLDVDIWFQLASSAGETRASISSEVDPPSMVAANGLDLTAAWGAEQRFLLKAAAQDPRVARIFVNPAIKRDLCRTERDDRTWLQKVRPWYGHDAHFHVRLHCPPADAHCRSQPPPPPGDGCGAELAWWLTPEASQPRKGSSGPPEPLPRRCQALLEETSDRRARVD